MGEIEYQEAYHNIMRGIIAPFLIVTSIIILSMEIVSIINLSYTKLMTIEDRLCYRCGHVSDVESILPFWSCEHCGTIYNITEGRRIAIAVREIR